MDRDTKASLTVLGAAALASAFVRLTEVKGSSMEGELSDGDYLLVRSRPYRKKTPCRGDIVVVESSLEDERGRKKKLIKRVIGLPGETVSISGGEVFVDGKRLEESYLDENVFMTEAAEYPVPGDSVFLMGDNRSKSLDSRSEKVGAVKLRDIYGKAFIRVWPFQNRKLFDNEKR